MGGGEPGGRGGPPGQDQDQQLGPGHRLHLVWTLIMINSLGRPRGCRDINHIAVKLLFDKENLFIEKYIYLKTYDLF